MQPKTKLDTRYVVAAAVLSSLTILAVQLATRVPWKSDSQVTKTWWCFLYLLLVIACFVWALCCLLYRTAENVVAIGQLEETVSRRGKNRELVSFVSSQAENMCRAVVLAPIAFLCFLVALCAVAGVLDHASLSCTTKRVLAGVEAALLLATLVTALLPYFCCSLAVSRVASQCAGGTVPDRATGGEASGEAPSEVPSLRDSAVPVHPFLSSPGLQVSHV